MEIKQEESDKNFNIKQEPCDQNTKDPMKMEMLEIKKEVSDENCMEEKSHGEGLFKRPLIIKFDRIVENKFQLMFQFSMYY